MKRILLIFLLQVSLPAFSQDNPAEKELMNCETLLKDAQVLFDAGNYDQVFSTLEEGLRSCNFSKAMKERAVILMIQAQIEKENETATDSLVYRLLKSNPNYRLTDPDVVSRYNTAIKKYIVRPAFIVGIQGGFTLPFSHIQTVYSILDGADYTKKYTSQFGITTGLHFEWQFMPRLSICADPSFSRVSYKRTITGEREYNLQFSEVMSNYDGALILKYSFPVHRFLFSVAGGYSMTSIRSASADVELSYTAYNSITGNYDPYRQASNKINLMADKLRQTSISSPVIGLGTAYRIDNFIFSVDARYLYCKTNMVNPDQRYANAELVFDYYYIDNDFDINRLEIKGGISYILAYRISKKSK